MNGAELNEQQSEQEEVESAVVAEAETGIETDELDSPYEEAVSQVQDEPQALLADFDRDQIAAAYPVFRAKACPPEIQGWSVYSFP